MSHGQPQESRQEKFAREFVIDLNATRAAIAAGYSENGASVAGTRLLANARVKRIIAELQTRRASKLGIKSERVVEELMRLGLANMQDYVALDAEGKPRLDFARLDRDKFAAVQEIKEDTTGGSGDGERRMVLRTTFKLADKMKALELLGRHLGMFQDNVKVTGLESLAMILAERDKETKE